MRPLATALFGLALCLAGATFDTPSLYVPGVALIVIAGCATGWVLLAANGAVFDRATGPQMVVEEEAYPLRIEVRAGTLPPPGGELIEPLLGWPVSIAGRWSRRVRINVRFSRRGRRVLEPGRLVLVDCEREGVQVGLEIPLGGGALGEGHGGEDQRCGHREHHDQC